MSPEEIDAKRRKLTVVEIEDMRAIVAQHDSMKLNPIPFPKAVYHIETSAPDALVSKVVANQSELDAALADGWGVRPPDFNKPVAPAPAAPEPANEPEALAEEVQS